MISLGQVVVLAVAAAWVFGPNELPRIARTAGRLTGQATGFLYRTRAKLFQFAEETEMTKLHQDVQATMYQLSTIRSELQGGINIFDPGPLMQRVMSVRPVPRQSETDPFQAMAAQQQQYQQAPGVTPPTPQSPALGSWAASAVQAAVPAAWQQHPQQHLQHPQQQRRPRGGYGDEQQHPLTVQVSAVAAGWTPTRAGTVPSSSEILLDALAEELVAAQALRLQQQQMAAAAATAAAQRQQQATSAAEQQKAEEQQPGDDSNSKDFGGKTQP